MDPSSNRPDRWIPSPEDPIIKQRNPFQVFLLAWAFLASLPLLLHGSSGSGVLDKTVDRAVIYAWGASLLIGTGMALVAAVYPRRLWTRLVVERSGMILVASAAFVYSYVVWVSTSGPTSDVRYALALQIGFGFACCARAWQITRRLRWARQFVHKLRQRGYPM